MKNSSEKILLGSILTDPGCWFKVAQVVSPVMFTMREEAQAIWQQMQLGGSMDVEILKSRYTIDLYDFLRYGNPADALDHAEIVLDNFYKKSEDSIQKNYKKAIATGMSYLDALSAMQAEREVVFEAVTVQEDDTELYRKALEYVLDVNTGQRQGITTGKTCLDGITGGWEKGTFNILAARPGMGKTQEMLEQAIAAAKSGKKVVIISREMSRERLARRIVFCLANLHQSRLTQSSSLSGAEKEAIVDAAERASDLSIKIFDSKIIRSDDVGTNLAKVLIHKIQSGCDILFVDYLQKLTSQVGNFKRHDLTIGGVSHALQQFAATQNIPIVCLSQLSREVEKRLTKLPQLADLRESGQIEQDADFIGFLYRPEYYQILEDENGDSLKGITHFIVAKNRDKPLATLIWKWHNNRIVSELDLMEAPETMPQPNAEWVPFK